MAHSLCEVARPAEQRSRAVRDAVSGGRLLRLEEAGAGGGRCEPERRGSVVISYALLRDRR